VTENGDGCGSARASPPRASSIASLTTELSPSAAL
jgi:hypothetical protein